MSQRRFILKIAKEKTAKYLKNYNVKNPKTLKGEAINKKGDIFYYNSIKNPVDKFLDKKCGGWMTWAINHS